MTYHDAREPRQFESCATATRGLETRFSKRSGHSYLRVSFNLVVSFEAMSTKRFSLTLAASLTSTS